mmetsp:Transcript_7383/g.18778  ORF Transcript_7383/g.18778 Transcript_7383/m.18778 type:complete len:193 (-) Transcript_7383:111-689(-)
MPAGQVEQDFGPQTAPEVTLNTSVGPITVELYYKHAPKACQNFLELARRGYYDGVPFHRIITDFMIQGGDPTGTGRGGQSVFGSKFEDEITRDLKHTGAGVLSMANSGPNTNGSQFFITTVSTPHLNGKHVVFGEVTDGMDVVRKIESLRTNQRDHPNDEVVIANSGIYEEGATTPKVGKPNTWEKKVYGKK